MFDELYIFVPSQNQIIRIAEGTGDNLLREDIEEGYRDYVDYTQYYVEDGFPEDDGGMYLYRELIQEKFTSLEECIPDVLDMAYGSGDLEYMVLRNKRSKNKQNQQ